METTPAKLTTAAKVLAAFNAVTNDAELNTNPESAELLKDLAQLFIHKPIGEIVGSVGINADAVHSALLRMFDLYPDGSKERKALVEKQLSLVDDFVKAGKLDRANDWLATGFQLYSGGSAEEEAVVAKGVSLVDDFVRAGEFDVANAWLKRGYNAYVSGSKEREAVAAKQEQLRQLRSSEQMGAAPKIDITGLRTVAKQELAKLQVASVGH